MNMPRLIYCTLLAAALVATPAAAYESENAIPLAFGLETGAAAEQGLSIRLDGRDVSISTRLTNNTEAAQKIGWYASTPHFGVLGEGEEYADKSFADITARFNGQPSKAAVYRRGYFMGRDITSELARAGLGPLPDFQVDSKRLTVQGLHPEQWQGYVAYTWHESLSPGASGNINVSYRALPFFALVSLDSAPFNQTVQQHCGDPEAVRQRLRQAAGAITEVMVESYEVPVSFMLMRDVPVEIVQPPRNWQDAQPVVSLLCGLSNDGLQASLSGSVANANLSLSVLVISALADAQVQR
jgi:hypothetical protein